MTKQQSHEAAACAEVKDEDRSQPPAPPAADAEGWQLPTKSGPDHDGYCWLHFKAYRSNGDALHASISFSAGGIVEGTIDRWLAAVRPKDAGAKP